MKIKQTQSKDNKSMLYYMKYLLVGLITFFIMGCGPNGHPVGQINNTTLSDTISMKANNKDRLIDTIQFYDSSICDIILNDTASIQRVIGRNIDDKIDWDNEAITIFNVDRTQFLQMHPANGGYKNEFNIFYVGYTNNIDSVAGAPYIRSFSIRITKPFFISSYGVYLGMSINDFNQKCNSNIFNRTVENDKIIYRYHNESITYIAEYVFKKSILYSFQIGYDNS